MLIPDSVSRSQISFSSPRPLTIRAAMCGTATYPSRVSDSASANVASSPLPGEAVTVTVRSLGRWVSTFSSVLPTGSTS